VVISLETPDEIKKLVREDLVLFKKGAISAAAVHQGGRKFATEFGASLGEEARKPRNSADSIGLGGKRRGIKRGYGRTRVLRVVKIIAPNQLDGVGLIVTGFAIASEIVDVIVKVLRGDAVVREKSGIGGRE
jgi:hypothetical protein